MIRTTQLFELQQVDSQSDDLLRRVLGINAALGNSESLRPLREAQAAAQAALAAGQEQLRAISHEVDELSAHLALQSKRLYDGSIKNSKELVAIEHDVASTKQVRSVREDRMLEAMEAVDQQQAALDALTQELEVAETEWQRNQEGMLEDKDKIDTQLRALRTHRARMAAEVPPADLQLYERLRKAKHGIAITALEHDICHACRVKVSGGIAVTARQGQEFAYCPSCARILHPGPRGELVRW
ncbi:MAG TPA: hypothetical protein VM536_11755 [Chloroflexia bacterium]|nr:hypothetical protein [Chloroflexia bacterium]